MENDKGKMSEERIGSSKLFSMAKELIEKEETIPSDCQTNDFYSRLLRGALKLQTIQPAKLSCLLTNGYGGMHGGGVASVSELVSIACARTVVGKDKDLFLGELSMSYLSAAPGNAEVIVDASVVRTGRNLTVVSVDFRLSKTRQLVYTSRFSITPSSS